VIAKIRSNNPKMPDEIIAAFFRTFLNILHQDEGRKS
jgi:hypothetical protein